MLLPREHTVMVRQTSKWGQILLLSLVGLGATAFATAWFYRLDEIITVQGRLVPSKGGVEVKSPITGQLSEILVTNGQRVDVGEPLCDSMSKTHLQPKKPYPNSFLLKKNDLNNPFKASLKN